MEKVTIEAFMHKGKRMLRTVADQGDEQETRNTVADSTDMSRLWTWIRHMQGDASELDRV